MADFDFRLGRRNQLRGNGWRGLLALFMLLATFVFVVALAAGAFPGIDARIVIGNQMLRSIFGR